MAPLFRRVNKVVRCFFCNEAVSAPSSARSFKCPSCGCLNRYNANGEIDTDEPAMHEESWNSESFNKRATHSRNQIPNAYKKSPFCDVCLHNQRLIVSLLATYIPAPESPGYKRSVSRLDQYKESLHLKYPPVCEQCMPGVEEEIANKNEMARQKALGGLLKEGKLRHRRVSSPGVKDHMVIRRLQWKIRGLLWFCSALTSTSLLIFELLGHSTIARLPWGFSLALPFLVLLSLLWTAWDPNYITLQQAIFQGREVRAQGKATYNKCQISAWFSRLVLSTAAFLIRSGQLHAPKALQHYPIHLLIALCLELLALLAWPLFLSVQHPPPIRLIDTQTHRTSLSRSATPSSPHPKSPTAAAFGPRHASERDLLTSLSHPAMTPSTPSVPKFGVPSLGLSKSSPQIGGGGLLNSGRKIKVEEQDVDSMDWSPPMINGSTVSPSKSNAAPGAGGGDDDSAWLRPQRFFAPESFTGLESLLSRTQLADEDDMMMQVDQEPSRFRSTAIAKGWRQWYIPVAIIAMIFTPMLFYLIHLRNTLSSFQSSQSHPRVHIELAIPSIEPVPVEPTHIHPDL